MSKYRAKEPWYYAVVTIIKLYPAIKTSTTERAITYSNAIAEALEWAKTLPDGELRVKAIEMIYFKNTHTHDRAAMVLHVSKRTVQRWTSSFIYRVGRSVGF